MRTTLNDKLISDIIERAESCNQYEINKYITEVAEKCVELCRNGEPIRVLNEYKFMIENLRKSFYL